MKILIAPLNWGLGHASRCIPLIHRHIEAGDEVVLGGNGSSLTLLRKRFPQLRSIEFAQLQLTYSSSSSQVWAMARQLPKLLYTTMLDHYLLSHVQRQEHFDLVISDNRFGMWVSTTRCVYMTHQVHIPMPQHWTWLQPFANALHRWVWKQYDELWIPDDAHQGLSGQMAHTQDGQPLQARYIGPQSRFTCIEKPESNDTFDVVAVLSGLEPQRTLFEREIVQRYTNRSERVLIVQGQIGTPLVTMRHNNITRVPTIDDRTLYAHLLGARTIIARSGYSTIMDLACTGLLGKADLYATPGQPEQEYLLQVWHDLCSNHSYTTTRNE